MPYPENFVVRLIISVVGMFALWMAAHYIGAVFIRQEASTISAFDIVIPLALGIFEAIIWKPKDKK